MRILLVEDDRIFAGNLATLLRKSSYAVDVSPTIADGYQKIIDETYDLCIIDRNLPDGDGMTLVRRIRNERITTLILILTALSDTGNEIQGLNHGADDYLGKPFAIEVLLARIRTLLRRISVQPLQPEIHVSDLHIDTNTRSVKRNGKDIHLSPREYALLEYMAKQKCRAIDRMELLSHVWDENADPFSNVVDVHIKNLRQKIDTGYDKVLIQTVKGIGYMVCDKNH